MTKKQIAALRRILKRETMEYQIQVGRPVPGQHRSEGKVAVSDGVICVLFRGLQSELPIGDRVDTFAEIMRNECICGLHTPVSNDQINISQWRENAKNWDGSYKSLQVELSVPQSMYQGRIDSVVEGPFLPVEGAEPITAKFHPQLLVDAVEAVGGKVEFYLGYGPFNSHFPSLLVLPEGQEKTVDRPVALVFPLK